MTIRRTTARVVDRTVTRRAVRCDAPTSPRSCPTSPTCAKRVVTTEVDPGDAAARFDERPAEPGRRSRARGGGARSCGRPGCGAGRAAHGAGRRRHQPRHPDPANRDRLSRSSRCRRTRTALTRPFFSGTNPLLIRFAQETMQQHDEHRQAFQAQTRALGGKVQQRPNPKYSAQVDSASPILTARDPSDQARGDSRTGRHRHVSRRPHHSSPTPGRRR